MPPDLERTIVTIRRRLEARLHPGARYQLIGASAILAELQALHIRPVPSERTIERSCSGKGLLCRGAVGTLDFPAHLSDTASPDVQRSASDRLGGSALPQRQAPAVLHLGLQRCLRWCVCLKLSRSRKMDALLAFLGDCWKTLGRPAQVQFDNARELVGWGPAARYLSRVIRLCLRFGIEPIFIPPRRPSTRAASKTSMVGSNRSCCNAATHSPVN